MFRIPDFFNVEYKITKIYSVTLHLSFKKKTTMKFTIFISVPFTLPC